MAETMPPYQPNVSVLKQLQSIDFVAVVGPSGAGKTTLINSAVEADSNVHYVVGDTSRAPRPGEQDGVDYYFRDEDEMKRLAEQGAYVTFVENKAGGIYGVLPESYGADGIAIMAVLSSAIKTFRALPFKSFRTIFITPPGFDAWQDRLGIHEFTGDQRARRLSEAADSYAFALDDTETTMLINDNREIAQVKFMQFLSHRAVPYVLRIEQPIARHIVSDILTRLGTMALSKER